jgi:methionine sulfoxide reductase heme-binding subunit
MTVASTPLWDWYLMRGSGLVALLLLSITVALGAVGVTRWSSSGWPRAVTAALHRNVPLLALVFLAVHITTAIVDTWVGVSWVGVVVPFTSTYRPLWVGLGAVAFDLLVAVAVTSLLRHHIGYRSWRVVHWGTWLLWPVALAHGVGAGTDAFATFGLAVWVSSLALAVAAAGWRLYPLVARRRRPLTPAPTPTPARTQTRRLT